MKRILKILGIVLILVIILLAAAPFLFKGSLEDLLKKNINENLNAQVSWESMDLSLFRNFPDAAVTLDNFLIVNNAPFKGDTLASGQTLTLNMKVTELFKSAGEPIEIKELGIDKTKVNILVDKDGNANYDIAKIDDASTNEEMATSDEEEGFTFALQNYKIENSEIIYSDEMAKTYFHIKEFMHRGSGDFSAKLSNLDTKTTAIVAYRQDDVQYMEETLLSLDAFFKMDLENQRYTFLENQAKVNELPLTFDGFIQVNKDNNELDITFKTPSSDFKNFLAVMPKAYVKNIQDVSTTGDFEVNGSLKGIVDDNRIPKMDIKISSNNASFKYPDLPKTVRNITIDAQLKNETGFAEDTFLNIGGITFKIDDEIFNANGTISNLTQNALVNLAIKGTLNLTNIDKVLPMELDQDLSGVFKADLTTRFDMNSIENEEYQNIKSNGTASLTNFKYSDEAFANELKIENADITFTPGNIELNQFEAATGQTDVSATGTIQNLIPWIMAKQDLKGNFNVNSNTFKVADFMASEENKESKNVSQGSEKEVTADEGIQIPDFLDATLNFSANKVIYDNLTLDNAKGTVTIKDETAQLTNVTSAIFGGNVAFSGNVSTQKEVPSFNMNLDLQNIDIDQSFSSLDLLKYIAPLAKALDGNINTKLNLQGDLNNNLTPKLETIAGNALAQILTAEVNANATPLLSKLGEKASFLNLERLSLRDLSTAVDFENGRIKVKPFDFIIKGIKVTASGSHGLDKSIDYNLNLDVPAQMLGGEINKLLSKLDPSEAQNMQVSLPVGLSGNFTNPNVDINTKGAISNLTQQIIEKQQQNLVDKGTGILTDLLTGGKDTPKDSTSTSTQNDTGTNQTTEIVKDVFGSIFGKKEKKKDSVNN